MEGKGASSSSSSSAVSINATSVSTIQSDFKESSKKKTGSRDTGSGAASVTASGRIKDKKKENHIPMETSDEEAPTIDVIGKTLFIFPSYLSLLIIHSAAWNSR